MFIIAIAEEALIGEHERDHFVYDGIETPYYEAPQPWVNFTPFAVIPDLSASGFQFSGFLSLIGLFVAAQVGKALSIVNGE